MRALQCALLSGHSLLVAAQQIVSEVFIMHPLLFSIPEFSLFGHAFGPIQIFTYGAMLALAFLLSITLAIVQAKKVGLTADDVMDMSIYIIVLAIVGARVGYVLTGWHEFQNNALDALKIHQGGLSFHGGVAGGALAVIYFCRRKKIPIFKMGDAVIPSLALGLAIGRIGCFLNGCCFGCAVHTHIAWAVVFPNLNDGVSRHPAQLYDSAMNFAMMLLLMYPLKKFKRKDGDLFAFWLILAGITRFIMEIFRAGQSSVLFWFGLTMAQWLCFLLVAGGIFLYVLKLKPAPAAVQNTPSKKQAARGK
jgi:phosphatidylglycerol---prolipoprotein diacylglyceryl transferase